MQINGAIVKISGRELALSLARDDEMTRSNYAGLMYLIVDVDEFVDDLQFTVALRDRLNEIIVECGGE